MSVQGDGNVPEDSMNGSGPVSRNAATALVDEHHGEAGESFQTRHQLFMQALESLLSDNANRNSHLQWVTVIAERLQWPIPDVEMHAFQYFMALERCDDREDAARVGDSATTLRTETENEDLGQHTSDWSEEELLLFDTLVAIHCPSTVSVNDNTEQQDWIQHVAQHLGGRTLGEVCQRWKQRCHGAGARAENSKVEKAV